MPIKDKQANLEYQLEHRKETRKQLVEYLKAHPCVVCGESDPVVLQFDHIDPSTKKASVSRLMSGTRKWETILKEIEKCQVLCANCHARKTYSQLSYWAKL